MVIQLQKPVTERKFHELPKEFEYTEGMTAAEIAKRIKREPAEIVKKLFMMGVMATQTNLLTGIPLSCCWLTMLLRQPRKKKSIMLISNVSLLTKITLTKMLWIERAPVVTIMDTLTMVNNPLIPFNSRVATEKLVVSHVRYWCLPN